eukprot:XP_011661883.1 PREDICTED: WD repeat-containing protein 1 [Strongylocentrotus purpuratus]
MCVSSGQPGLSSNPGTVRGAQTCLEGDPKGKKMLYLNGNNVIIRDIEDPTQVTIFNDHARATTSARWAPSGYYVASADEPCGGAALIVDTGTSCGTISTLGRTSTCDVRQKRPYRAVIGADSYVVKLFEGPPFKYKSQYQEHNNFVQKVRYAPNGEMFVSGGSDGKLFLRGGDQGELLKDLGETREKGKAHIGSIYGISWSDDSKKILTSSADKTAKIWDVETGQAVTEFTFGTDLEHQQLGCLWQGDFLLSLSLSGNINYLDPNDPSKPCRIVQGHQKRIVSIAVNEDRSKVFAGSYDGVTTWWDSKTGLAKTVEGRKKPTLITQIDYKEGKLSTVGMDDTMRLIDDQTLEYMDDSCGLDSQPQSVCRGSGGLTVVGGIQKVTIVRGSNKASVLEVTYNGTAVDIHPNQSEVAIGDEMGNIHVYTLAGDTLTEKTSFKAHCEAITRCRYSPDGEYLAVASASKAVEVYHHHCDYAQDLDRKNYKHNAKITDLAWSPDGKHYATTALDGSVYVWGLEKPNPIQAMKVHGRAATNCVVWLDNASFVTGGDDACLRTASVTF